VYKMMKFTLELTCCFLLLNNALVASFQGETINSNDDNHVSPEKFESLKHRINQEKSEKIKPIPEHVGMGKLSCFSCSPPDCRNATICHNAVRCQTAHTRDVDGNIEKQKGCIKTQDHAMFHCAVKSYNGEHIHKKNGRSAQYAFECCKENMCNENQEFPVLPEPYKEVDDPEEDNSKGENNFNPTLLIGVPLIAIVCIMVVFAILFCIRKKHIKNSDKIVADRLHQLEDQGFPLVSRAVGDSTLKDSFGLEVSCITSGSGSGAPRMNPRSLAHDIKLLDCIGKGRYCEVYKGRWNGDDVAVKVFFSKDEASFRRETEIYKTSYLRHDNILGYYGSDITSVNSCTQNWLVTHYYERGSLYDYLNFLGHSHEDAPDTFNEPSTYGLTKKEAYDLIFSALGGLVYLHTEFETSSIGAGSNRKPAIAHRDIKSKNILIHNNGHAVIADFGMAVTKDDLYDFEQRKPKIYYENDRDQNTRVGTKRYMSPEVLDLSILKNLEIKAFLHSDIYSFSLVMWEILRKTQLDDSDPYSALEYSIPYSSYIDERDPDFEKMKKVVCEGKYRPAEFWRQYLAQDPIKPNSELIVTMCKEMQNCWSENPKARLEGPTLKKHLKKRIFEKFL